MQILHLFGLSRLLSHSVFWDMFLMHVTFPILHSQQSEYLLPEFPPRTKHVLEGFSKSSFILRFPVSQEVLVISQIATAFHRIRLPLIIRSRLQLRLMSLLLLDVQLALQFRLSLIDEEKMFDDSVIILHNACHIPIIVRMNNF